MKKYKWNLYKTLEVDKNASQKDISKAYKKLAFKHHPDKGGDPEMMTRFNHARDVLLEPVMDSIAAE